MLISLLRSRLLGSDVSFPNGEGKMGKTRASCVASRAAVSETRDLRDEAKPFFFLHPSINNQRRRAKNCCRSLRTREHSPSLSFCCGESPRRCRVCDPVCACHGKRLPLSRQFELHVWGPPNPSSEMWNVAWARALRSQRLVIHAMI